MKSQDQLLRYTFEDVQVRGELVQLQDSFASMVENHNYPQVIETLLGELFAATCLLTATLKFEGDISVQMQGDGPLRYISINGTHQQALRGVARWNEVPDSTKLSDAIGKGFLVITITPTKGQRYQGIVPLEHDTLAACLEQYFADSEQLHTGIWLFTDINAKQAGGLLVQSLPSGGSTDESRQLAKNEFEHLRSLSETITGQELLNLEAEGVLYRLYHQEQVRLYEPQPVTFVCGCSKDRSMQALTSLSPTDLREMLAEENVIKLKCEYCLTEYSFYEADLLHLLNASEQKQ